MRKKLNIKNWLPFLLVIFISFFATRHLLLSGFLPTHDGEYHIVRLWQFDKMIKSGDFFPRWAPDLNNGYGVPLFQFFYPLPNYIGEAFHLLGFSLVDSIKLVLASGLLISALTFYFWMRCFFKKWPAAVGAIFYLLAPYHLVDVFIRGSVGEVWALALAPLVLFFTTGLVKAKKKERRKFLILNSTSLLFLLTSHNILGILFFFFSFLYGIVLIIHFQKNREVLFCLILSFLLSLGLVSFFWLPAILESKYVTGLKIINFQEHFPALFQLFIPSWGSGFSLPGISDEMSFQIGIPHILAFLAAFLLLVLKKRKDVLLIFFLTVFLITVFLMLESSLFVWRLLSFLTYFQYPWRLLSLIILLTSFFAAYIADFRAKVLVPTLIVLSLVFYLPYTKPVVYKAREDGFYLNNHTWTEGTATLGNSFNTIWFQKEKKAADDKVGILKGKDSIQTLKIEPSKYNFIIEAESLLDLTVKTAYFPGWKVLVDGQERVLEHANGLINFSVPEGRHSIIVKFEDTLIRRIANMVSLVSGLILLLLLCSGLLNFSTQRG